MQAIKEKFCEMEIYGHKFTAHHYDILSGVVREIITEFLNWVHFEGYLPIPHKDYQPRKWWRYMDGKSYDETDLFYAFMKYKNTELLEQRQEQLQTL